jgi:hypothetical protein
MNAPSDTARPIPDPRPQHDDLITKAAQIFYNSMRKCVFSKRTTPRSDLDRMNQQPLVYWQCKGGVS